MWIHWLFWCICNYCLFAQCGKELRFVGLWKVAVIESSPMTSQHQSIQLFALSATVFPLFQRQSCVHQVSVSCCLMALQQLKVIIALMKVWAQNGELLIFIFSFYAHHRPVLHRLITIHNATDGETDEADRAIGIGCCLCPNIGGLKREGMRED